MGDTETLTLHPNGFPPHWNPKQSSSSGSSVDFLLILKTYINNDAQIIHLQFSVQCGPTNIENTDTCYPGNPSDLKFFRNSVMAIQIT